MTAETAIEALTPEQIENQTNCCKAESLGITAFSAQEILFEFLAKYMQFNDPAKAGFKFKSRYNIDPTKSDILMEYAHDWKSQTAGKRPAVFISRSGVDIGTPTFGGTIGNEDESGAVARMTTNRMTLIVTVLAAPIGVVEGLAEWLKQGLVSFQHEIQSAFLFRRFRVKGMSQVQKQPDSKDMFAVAIQVDVAFDEGTVVRREAIKLKKVGLSLFDAVTGKPVD